MDTVNQIYLSQKKMKKFSEDEIDKLWEEYNQDKSNKKIKDILVVQYISLVKYVVGRMRVTLPETIPTEDIIGFGVEGLIKAIEKFEYDKHSRFETYAITRIRGGIIDGIRCEDWIPRIIRKQQKEINAVIQIMQKEFGRVPKEREVAKRMNMPLEKLQEILKYTSEANLISLNASKDKNNDTIEIIDTIEDENTVTPLEKLENYDSKKNLVKSLYRLPERERMILTLYYHENMTFGEIGDFLKISESRCCQLHAQAIMKLRNILSSDMLQLRRIVEE